MPNRSRSGAESMPARVVAPTSVKRGMSKRIAAVSMINRIGQEFDAIVTGATPKGTFVRVLQPHVEGLLVHAHTQLFADGIGVSVSRTGQGRTAGRRKDRARLARQQLAGLAFAFAAGSRHVDESDRHVDRQDGKTLAGFREGLHDSNVEDAAAVAAADHPAGPATVGAPNDQGATTIWPSRP